MSQGFALALHVKFALINNRWVQKNINKAPDYGVTGNVQCVYCELQRIKTSVALKTRQLLTRYNEGDVGELISGFLLIRQSLEQFAYNCTAAIKRNTMYNVHFNGFPLIEFYNGTWQIWSRWFQQLQK